MELPLPLVGELPSGSVTIPKCKEDASSAKKSVLENAPRIAFPKAVLTEIASMVFPPKCQLPLSLVSS